MISGIIGIFFWAVIIGIIISKVRRQNRPNQPKVRPNQPLRGGQAVSANRPRQPQPQVRPNQPPRGGQASSANRPRQPQARPNQQTYTDRPRQAGSVVQTGAYPSGSKSSSQPEILRRAAHNNARFQKDQTLSELESAHHHSERVSAPQREVADLPDAEHTMEEVYDLMVRGYEVNLSNTRDFVGEALDMINSFY